WSSGGQLYITAASTGTAQVYTLTGQPVATVALTAGETAATPLPPGVYIVAIDGKSYKVRIR
ncbi:MAG: T9SS type A sorting domain-containing protein, partial [Tannerella sp.]|nr:T9SS type A sorting domain-containing protein [Tannerella sp.]